MKVSPACCPTITTLMLGDGHIHNHVLSFHIIDVPLNRKKKRRGKRRPEVQKKEIRRHMRGWIASFSGKKKEEGNFSFLPPNASYLTIPQSANDKARGKRGSHIMSSKMRVKLVIRSQNSHTVSTSLDVLGARALCFPVICLFASSLCNQPDVDTQ